ncbi:Uncharacterised protein [Halioglobus japonicus]|nr:Uncharacterised protein [Halioglobus japonicus]
MGRWTREEIDDAFTQYQAMGLKAARSGDWTYWGDMFTENCTYIERNLGAWAGRDAIVRNMSAVMHLSGNEELGYESRDNGVVSDPWVMCNQYPVEAYVIDVERGWVWALIWNRMDDPGDGSIHQSNCFNLFKYAGNGQFSYEEDLYNPQEFLDMMEKWLPVWNAHNETSEQRQKELQERAEAARAFAEKEPHQEGQ